MDFFDPSGTTLFWIALISFAVIAVDIVLETEILGLVALFAISLCIGAMVDATLRWKIVVIVITFILLIVLFYLVWKRFCAPALRGFIPTGADEAIHSAVGSNGEYRQIEGKDFVSWNGDLWPVDPDDYTFQDHDKVSITAVENGVFSIDELSKNRSDSAP